MSESTYWLLAKGMGETLYMTFTAGFFSFLIGLPLGIFLFLTRERQLLESPGWNRVLSFFRQYIPVHPLYYSYCVDDSLYTTYCRHFDWNERSHCTTQHWRQSFCCPFSGKQLIGDSLWRNRGGSIDGCDNISDHP